jgi:hypothetical protein
MKIRPMFALRFGFTWDPNRRTFYFFPLTGLGLRFELGGEPVVRKALAAIGTDDELVLELVRQNPTACWVELKPLMFGRGLSVPRAVAAKDRLLAAGHIKVELIEAEINGVMQRRRVLVPTV